MASRTARMEWTGDFRTGQGTARAGSGAFEAGCSYGSIFREEPGTNPMEILGLSLAMCFTGALAAVLMQNGLTPGRIHTESQVRTQPNAVGKGYTVAEIHLHTQAEVPGIDESALAGYAEAAKGFCPVGLALGNVEITVETELSRG
jgi:osmotically inducible protein OsmC